MQFQTELAHLEFSKILLLCKIYTEMAIKKQYSLTDLFQSQPEEIQIRVNTSSNTTNTEADQDNINQLLDTRSEH